ncbi:NADh:flavin oxidoreductase NADh oxidase protein [Rutstroemia sp. NJR-2017a BVV2]|nr:NADh:flavin oxidoreductase NADh oxidase protein [Rutstroemia sp. NJR-2017a BVV2]
MSSTMTPFLYQTRTIARLQLSVCNKSCRGQILAPIHRRNIHTSLSHSADSTHTAQTSSSNASQDKSLFRGVRKVASSSQSRYSDNVGPTFEDLPRAWGSYGEMENKNGRPNTIDFDENDQELVDYGSAIDSLSNRSYPQVESTITDSERHAFHKIFSDIFKRSQSGTISDSLESRTPVDLENAKSRLDNILGDALSSPSHTLREKQIAVNKYPPALRAAAARAVGLYPQEDKTEDKPDASSSLDKLENDREIERERVEGLLRGAKTDFDLWEVLEREVFPLVGKMGLQENAPPEPKPIKPRGKNSTNPKYDKSRGYKNLHEDLPPFQKQPQELPQLALYGPLYPSYLLLSLRLLDRSFARSSPLALSLLPRIKSLGLISHVLGASTALYNELIQIYWFRHEDVLSCLDLLHEMEDAGLDLNKETYDIVTDIVRMRHIMRKGDMGESVRVRFLMPDFKKAAKLLRWKAKIGEPLLLS